MILRLHAVEPRSAANGPGTRFVIWFQGCTIGCPGCFNPLTHSTRTNRLVGIEALVGQVLEHAERIEGVTISGGVCRTPTSPISNSGRPRTSARERR